MVKRMILTAVFSLFHLADTKEFTKMTSQKNKKLREDLKGTFGFESDDSDSDPEYYEQKFYNLCQSHSSSETLHDTKDTSMKTCRERSYKVSSLSKRKSSSGASIQLSYSDKAPSPHRKTSNTRKASFTTGRKKSCGQKKGEAASGQQKGDISKTLWDVVSRLKKIQLRRKTPSLENPAELKRSSSKTNLKRMIPKRSPEVDESISFPTNIGKRPVVRKISRSKPHGRTDETCFVENRHLRDADGQVRAHVSSDKALSNWKVVQGVDESRPFNRLSNKSKLFPSIKHNASTDEKVGKRFARSIGKPEYATESGIRDVGLSCKYTDTQPQRKSQLNSQQNETKFLTYDPTESMSNSSFEYLCHYSQRQMPFSLNAIQSSLAQRRRYGDSIYFENEATSSREGLPTVFVEETSSREHSVSPPVEDNGFLSLPSSEPLSESSSSNSPYFFSKLYSSSDRCLSGADRYDSAVGLSPEMRSKGDNFTRVTTCDRGVSPVIFGKVAENEKVLISRHRVRSENFPRNDSLLIDKNKSRSDVCGQLIRGPTFQSKLQGSGSYGSRQDFQKPNSFKKSIDQLKGIEGLYTRDSQRENIQDSARDSPASKSDRKQSTSKKRNDDKKHDSTLPPIHFEKHCSWRK